MNFNWQEVFNKFSDDLANAFDLFTGNLKLTKVFKATIIEKINDTVYKVSYKYAEYKVKSYYDLIIGDIVWVCAPGGDWDSLFVQSYNGFLDRIVTTDKVVNNLTTNVAGTVLDGRMGKSLNDKITTLNSNLAVKPLTLSTNSGALNGSSQTAFQIGKVVYITGHINPKNTGTDSILMGSAPVPKSDTDIYFNLSTKTATAYGYGRITLGENTLKFTVSASGENYVFNFCYVTN